MWKKSRMRPQVRYRKPKQPVKNTYKVFATVEYKKEFKIRAESPEEAGDVLEERLTKRNKTRESQGYSLGDIYIHEVNNVNRR
jgi:hypothetical protein